MLSAEARPYIDASVPVLREHGLAITTTFYRNMFAAHPELTNLFNMGNQASGAQQQSLASAVFAYAANIDNAAALGPVVSRIVHKHASVGITAEHYPIVGRHLLGAIQETLGAAATPDLLSAWEEAYGLLAHALITEERKLYEAAGTAPGALQSMRVVGIENQGTLARSFTLAPMDGEATPDFVPGQYVSVAVDLPGGLRQLRQYSLSDAPGQPTLRISVKREVAGQETPAGQVSNWLHDNLEVGGMLAITKPFGDFQPDVRSTTPIVLLSAGIGITPMIGTLNAIARCHPQREVVFGYAARDAAHHPHRQDLADAQARMPNLRTAVFYETLDTAAQPSTGIFAGRMDVARLPVWAYADQPVYLCGPLPFMQVQWRDLVAAGVPPTRIHREVFGPDLLDHLL
ncbi:flavohemoprotein [Imbroritus primus]|uniref:Flavohemoprotein n=1 Tax=Imbroritus primus TaxID=3058603 RepID=A0ACD3SQR6_9BURK|nr:flavohemoprotein [Burkholderiaceae bacterium PBA]